LINYKNTFVLLIIMLMKKKSLSNTWVDETITYYFLEKVNINKVKWNFKRSRWSLVGGS